MKLPPGYVPGLGVHRASAYGGVGERLLKGMGWQDGQGLGRSKKGIQSALEVKRKDDTAGIGSRAGYDWENKWWEAKYNRSIETVEEAASPSDSDTPSSPGAGRARRAGRRDGTRASAAASELEIAGALAAAAGRGPAGRFSGREGKLARIRAQEAAFAALRGADGAGAGGASGKAGADAAGAANSSDASCETAVEAAAAGAAAGGSRASRPGKRRAAGSAAPEGGGEPGACGVQQPKGRRVVAQGAGEPEAGRSKRRRRVEAGLGAGVGSAGLCHMAVGAGGANSVGPKMRRKAAAAGSPAVADPRSLPDASPGSAGGARSTIIADPDPVRAPDPGARSPAAAAWWGAGRFVSAGCLEGLGHKPAATRERRAFDEDDQAGLYMAAHAAKTANKKGLGTRAVLKTAASERWAGQRTVFAEADAAADLPQAGAPPPKHAPSAAEALNGMGATGSAAERAASGAASIAAVLAGVKWRKLAARALTEVPLHTLTLKALRRAVAAALAAKGSAAAGVSRKQQAAALLAAVSGSARFVLEGKLVRMASPA